MGNLKLLDKEGKMKRKENKKMKEVSEKVIVKDADKEAINSTEKDISKVALKHPKSGKGL
jgi:hypothetical protein